MRTIGVLLCAALALSGCATLGLGGPKRPVALERPPFPADEYAELARRVGSGAVYGQVIMRTQYGPRFGAGEEVLLNPVTSYSSFWYENKIVAKRELRDPDPRQDAHILIATADGSGSFRFDRVPAGDYYLTSQVRWSEPGHYVGQIYTRVQTIAERVTVTGGGELRHILTN